MCKLFWLVGLLVLPSLLGAQELLTKAAQQERYNALISREGAEVTDGGDFIVVQSPATNQLVAFTKLWHPADPGIVEITIYRDGRDIRVRSHGEHGTKEAAFNQFHAEMNRELIPVARKMLGGE